MDTNRFMTNLQHQVEENPVLAIAAAGALLGGASKFINSLAWKQEVTRRVRNNARK